MAFEKEITLPNGVKTFYHKMVEVHWDRTSKDQLMKISSWINKEALEAGYNPAETWPVQLNDAFGPELTQGVLDACTVVLAAQPQFEGATVVPDVDYVPPAPAEPDPPVEPENP